MAEDPTATIDPVVDGDPAPADPAPEPTPDPEPEPPAVNWPRTEGMGLDDDTIGWLENKDFKTLQTAITAQRELETKLGGPSDMLQIWPEADDAEGFKAIHQRLGCPKDAGEYTVEFEEGASVDADTLTWFKEKAFSHNMTTAQVQGMALDWNAKVAQIQEEQQQALEIRDQTENTELANAWGSKLQERLDYGHRALIANGLLEEDIDAINAAVGPKKLAQWAAKIADTMGEDTIAANTSTPAFGTSKEQVKSAMDELLGEIGADTKRYNTYKADHSAPKESTGKDYRKMQQLRSQYENLMKAEKGAV